MESTKITLEQILIGEQALVKLGEARTLSAKTKYWIGKILEIASKEVKNYQELRIEALKKYGTQIENTQRFEFTEENKIKFNEEIGELVNVEISIPSVSLSFTDLDKVDLSASEMVSIDWMIDTQGDVGV